MPTTWEPMLAKPAATLPAVGGLLGGTVYEPKWDGYRAILERTSAGCRVWSRKGADLAAGFPEIVQAALEQLEPGTVIDGELVVWRDGRLDFGALAPRLAYRGRRGPRADLPPASFLAFDVLAAGDVDLRTKPLRDRRAVLEQLAGSWQPPMQLTPQTADPAEAQRWLTEYAAAEVGVEGLVAKGAGQRYLPGQRVWVKFRIRNTREATVGAVIGRVDQPVRLILGLRDAAGTLRVAGATHPLSSRESAELAAVLVGTDDHPWPAELSTRQLGRFSREPVAITRVTPTVIVEVEADTAFEHGRWRHLTRYCRLRLDLSS
ncbi:ATP-dependent DNA ligase [Nocardioides sp. IC4_145]|uniref:ATP-dependent DNA ligase n=1 Tax=Nocardioides sp. IC4_145 TaxID=2714037 RepID=UPI00140A0C40|nr:ATP-dependent DNA ligase [Nocardioides sp. IC4_145]